MNSYAERDGLIEIIITADQLIGMKELPVHPGADLVNHGRLQVNEHGPGHVFARSGLWNSKRVGLFRNATKTVPKNYITMGTKRTRLGRRWKRSRRHCSCLRPRAWSRRGRCRARGSRAPSTHFRSAPRPGPRGRSDTRASRRFTLNGLLLCKLRRVATALATVARETATMADCTLNSTRPACKDEVK